MYNDRSIKRKGFVGEGRADDHVVVIKTHRSVNYASLYDRAIVIIRDPHEAMMAEYKRRHGGHTSDPNDEIFKRNGMYVIDATPFLGFGANLYYFVSEITNYGC